jgi:hypothetical protein
MNLVNKSRKAFTATVVAATIAWSMGLSGLTAIAATPASGSLIKASLPTVYYLGADNKRYVFPNQNAYKTWYADFSSVQTITDAELAALPLGGNVTYRPGVKMVKITTDPKTYAVAKGGVLRWVKTEAVAVALYGSTWNKQIDDVADSFFTNYTVGADISSTGDYLPATETANSGSINVDKSLATGGTTVSGSLTATLSASQPAGGILPLGATGVSMVKVDVRNGGASSAVVDSMTVRRTGVGSSADFSYLYAYDGNNRLTTGRTLNSTSNEATFSGLNVSLAAGETKTLWISADIAAAATAGNENALQVVSVMSGSATASGLPVSGPTFRLAGSSVGSVTIATSSTSLSDVTAGATMAKVADFKLTAGSSESIVFNRIALSYNGTVTRSDITNLVLKQGGNTIATVAGITDKDLAVFVLSSPMTMEKGASRIFEVYADVAGTVRSAETIIFSLDQTTDLSAVGSTYGYGVTVTSTYGTGITASILAGQLTATFNGPAAKNVAANSTGVELFNYTLAAQSNLEVRETKLTVTATNLADVENFKIVDSATGALIAGPVDVNTSATCVAGVCTFTEVYNLTAGQARTFKVMADIDSAAAATNTIQVTLGVTTLFSANEVRNLDNSSYVLTADMVPSGVIAGNTHTVQVAALTTSVASTPVSQSYIQGSQGVSMLGINLKAGDAAGIGVSSVMVTGDIDGDNDGTYNEAGDGGTLSNDVLTASLWNGATQVGTTKSPSSARTMTFDNLNIQVPAGQTVTLTLKANLASSIGTVTTANPDKVLFKVASAADVIATDTDGNSVTPTGTATGNAMTVAAAGTLAVAKAADDSESEAGLVVANGSNVVLAKYKLSATNEELKLTKVRLNVATANAVQSLSLWEGATLVGGPVGVDGSGNADFTGLSLVVPKDASKVMTVKASLGTVGAGGATTASAVTVTLKDTVGTFEARGTSAGSNTLIIDVDGDSPAVADTDVAANAKITRKSKPTVSLSSLPSTSLSAGDITIMRFTVSADAAGDVALREITASTVLTSAGTIALPTSTDPIRRVGGDYVASYATYAAGVTTVTFDSEEVIPAGTTKTYDLVMKLGGTLASGDTLVSNLTGDTTSAAAAAVTNTNPAAAHEAMGAFVWSDMALSGHDYTTADWTNGYKVKGTPTDAQTLSK